VLSGEFDQCAEAGTDDVKMKPLLRSDLAEILHDWIGPPRGVTVPVAQEAGGGEGQNAPAVAGPQEGPIDFDALAELVGDDQGMVRFAFTEFLETTPPDLSELASAVTDGDQDRARAVAHRIKGSCNMIGASEAGALAYQLEQDAFAGPLPADYTLPEDVRQSVEHVMEFLRDWLDKQGG